MKEIIKRFVNNVVFITCFVTVSYACHLNRKPTPILLDQDGYDLSFKNSAGDSVTLKQFKGKVVLINLWATWCAPCLAEMPSLDRLYKHFQGNSRIVFLAVDMDGNLRSSAKFLRKRNYTLPLYQLNSNLPRDLSTTGIPTTIILDKTGKLVHKHIGGMNFDSQKFKKALQQLSEE